MIQCLEIIHIIQAMKKKLHYNWDNLDWPSTEQIPVQPETVVSAAPLFLVHLKYIIQFYYLFETDAIKLAGKYSCMQFTNIVLKECQFH